jgi:hypothetical protein
MVAPPANSASTLSLETWSAISAPKPPEAVYADAASTEPSCAIRMNGVRTPRVVMSSSTASVEKRSSKAPGSWSAGESSGSRPQ